MFKLFKKTDSNEIEITVSNQTVLRVLALVFGAILFLAAVKQAQQALVLIFVAFFLCLALNAPVQWIARHLPGKFHGRRTTATAISFLVVVVLLGAFIASIVPPLVQQTQNFISAAPQLIEDTREGNGPIGQVVQRYGLENEVDEFSSELGSRLKGAAGSAISGLGKIGTSIFSVLTILVLTFMMLIEGPRALRFFRELVPARKRDDADRLSMEMYRVVKGYVNGQVTLAALAAVLIAPLFFILDINYATALIVIVFICGLIPMVGHTIGAIIVTLVALATSPVAALIILSYYILYQQIENYLVQPRIQANSTNMSPLLVFISVIIGVSFGGLFGGLFAIPVAGCIRILFLDYLHNHELLTTHDKPTVKEELAKAGTKKTEDEE